GAARRRLDHDAAAAGAAAVFRDAGVGHHEPRAGVGWFEFDARPRRAVETGNLAVFDLQARTGGEIDAEGPIEALGGIDVEAAQGDRDARPADDKAGGEV